MTLPSSPGNNVFVRLGEKTLTVEKTSVFQLYYSGSQELTVTAGDSMVNKLCGACDKMIPFRDAIDFPQDTMQEYMASFTAPDFPSW